MAARSEMRKGWWLETGKDVNPQGSEMVDKTEGVSIGGRKMDKYFYLATMSNAVVCVLVGEKWSWRGDL